MVSTINNQGFFRTTLISLKIADSFGGLEAYWNELLTQTSNPQNGNDASAIAIRTFVSERLKHLSPERAVALLEDILVDNSSTWETLGIASITDETIGQSLTEALREELITLISQFSSAYINSFVTDLQTEVSGGYAYGNGLTNYFSLIN